jgi:hypothetical protein
MPFHIEISSAFERIRVLNVQETEVHRDVLEPWVAGLSFELGGHGWQPRESRLTILEGPAVDGGADGAGWESALRTADDVTRALLEAAESSAPAQTAVEVDADSVGTAVQELSSGRPPRQISWSRAAERIGGRDPEIAAVILVVKRRQIDWPEL